MIKPEILSPAGDFSRLKYAIMYGADAVYNDTDAVNILMCRHNITLTHIIAVVAYKHSTVNAVHICDIVDEICVVIFKTDFHIEFDFAFLCRLTLDHTAFCLFAEEFIYLCFSVVIFTAYHNNIGMCM